MNDKMLKEVVWEEEGYWIDSDICTGEEGKPEDLFYEGETLEQAMHGNFTKTKVWTHKYRDEGHAVFDNELEALEDALDWVDEDDNVDDNVKEKRLISERIKELKEVEKK